VKIVYAICLTASTLLTLPHTTTAADIATSDSYYHLDVALETQAAESLHLSDMQGAPVIVAMFYSSCGHVCPLIITTIGMIEARLPPAARAHMRVLMISLDPEKDTPAALAALAERHRVHGKRWRFARSAPDDVRVLAAMLGVKYRTLPDGAINHSSPILLLDADGRETARSEKLGVPDPLFVQQVATAFGVQESGEPLIRPLNDASDLTTVQ
jgi:protein SCO1/2